jgi:hypothetical protein
LIYAPVSQEEIDKNLLIEHNYVAEIQSTLNKEFPGFESEAAIIAKAAFTKRSTKADANILDFLSKY